MTFIEFVVDTFIKEANQYGHKQAMLKAFRTEDDDQLAGRVGGVIDSLEIAYVLQRDGPCIHDRGEAAKMIVVSLKEKLVAEIATAPA